ncbi:Multidrug resistance protein abc superfamily [Globisporangium polare]
MARMSNSRHSVTDEDRLSPVTARESQQLFFQMQTPRQSLASLDVKPQAQPKKRERLSTDTSRDSGDNATKTSRDQDNLPSFLSLYRFATPRDVAALVVGVVMAAINGGLYPCMALVFGDAISAFAPFDKSGVNQAALEYLAIAIALFVTDYLAFVLFANSAERQMKALREHALRHLLHLDISWYDSNDAMQLSSRITGDTIRIKIGMGQKLGDAVKYLGQFVGGYVIGFVKGWDIALVMCCVTPAMVYTMSTLLSALRVRATRSQQLYAEAGAIAEETLASMRTVASLNGERRAIAKYNAKTETIEQENIVFFKKAAVINGFYTGCLWLIYAAGLWYGGKKVYDGDATPGTVFQAFFGIVLGSYSMGQISPNLSAVAEAKGSAAALFAILDTHSVIDAASDTRIVPEYCSGAIEAESVSFAYPSRPEAQILNNYSVKIAPGKKVAFVGPSGGGKSTLIALLERFYDPTSGVLRLDGHDVKTLNVKWLRAQIGLVSQEPVLFASSVYDNIAVSGSKRKYTREQVVAAAKLANAHSFIMSLPQQYGTLVGEKGMSLSGGQKQRVAIARALVREPKILVLDEATSALDAESERIVQAALNGLMEKTQMTTLIIAHRLSTVRNADKIVVVSKGSVIEEGAHDELMAIPDGVYRNLYTIQQEKAKDEKKNEEGEFEDSSDDEEADPEAAVEEALRQSSLSGRRSSVYSTMSYTFVDSSDETPEITFTMKDAMALSRPERSYFIRGLFAAGLHGLAVPSSALLISELLAAMNSKYATFQATKDHSVMDDLKTNVTTYGLCYVGGAVALVFIHATQIYNFRYMAEKLTSRLRDLHFTSLLRQDIGFFDETAHATGAMTSDLAMNAAKVSLLSGDSQGRLLQAVFTFVAAVLLSFTTGSWLLTLIMLAVFPLLILGEVLRFKQMKGSGILSDELAESGAHASEALCSIRTVVALGLQDPICDKFSHLLEKPLASGQREARINGLSIGFSSFILFAAYALVFWYGGEMVNRHDITFKQLIRTLMAIMMSAQGIAYAASWLGESDHAIKAGAAIFSLRDRSRPVDSFDESGTKLETLEGRLEFKDITFRYPTRPNVTVLRHYDLTVEAGQTVAFCGPSGGGKSTIIALLERFYDPLRGQVLLDGVDTKALNVNWLRSQIGMVGQEPTLFIGTIAENIAYGLDVQPSQDEVEVAAKVANAHDFITRFPDSYQTQVGMKGEQLSGGQKQRIAIARAILKNPNILLLDEATSALDSESEQIVQQALDTVVALKRRTTIIIAHRLSTIRNADKICVVSGGRVAEEGTHAELLGLSGIYARLVESSSP